MNPENFDIQESVSAEAGAAEQLPEKRPYKKRDPKVPTIASLNEQIEAKKRQIEIILAEIESLTERRNNVFFGASEMIGLIDIMADPKKAKWLAEKLDEYKYSKHK